MARIKGKYEARIFVTFDVEKTAEIASVESIRKTFKNGAIESRLKTEIEWCFVGGGDGAEILVEQTASEVHEED